MSMHIIEKGVTINVSFSIGAFYQLFSLKHFSGTDHMMDHRVLDTRAPGQ